MNLFLGIVCGILGVWVIHRVMRHRFLSMTSASQREQASDSARPETTDGLAAGSAVEAVVQANVSASAPAESCETGPVADSGQADDLMRISGIGPRIFEVLQHHRINRFVQLAGSEPGTLADIMKSAGIRIRHNDPQSWREQAVLADRGDWDALRELQAEQKKKRKLGVDTAA